MPASTCCWADPARSTTSRTATDSKPRRSSRGIYGLSNHWLDSPWPKLLRTRTRLAELIAADDVAPAALFALLADRAPADLDETPDTGLPPEWERALSSPFVVHERYGTRCSTVLLVEPTAARRCSSGASTRRARDRRDAARVRKRRRAR